MHQSYKPSRRTLLAILAATAACVALPVRADTYPSRPIRVVVPFAAGGNTDIVARLIGRDLQKALGQPVVVENRPGASGNIGADIVAKSAPDGYTFLMGTVGTNAINASFYRKMPYDTAKDFTAVAMVASVPNILVVNPAVPAKNVKELTQFVKSENGKATFASSGAGSSIHLSGELYKVMTGTQMVHVPYKGSALAVTDLMGGQVQIMFDNAPTSLPFVKSGKLKALAVTGTQRMSALPDVPTMEEAGLPGFVTGSWFGLFAPAGTPREIVSKVSDAVMAAMRRPEFREQLVHAGAEPDPKPAAEFQVFALAEKARWEKVVKAAGVSVNE
ncbi:Bug family tripartite tricarboxylate transporter substrate binding protein [Cupriavidus basilensis]|uniref:Bug family tripartite tricarboxylate transporter substrate binding protein n=1 Tax=Cupriavidus basilensis TaxID=68895 RepID=UPI0020A6C90F|nr:tripartite tricarboxylate transporter substrate binding protein [Cupriavidus basilensis]MCP3022470.1 tripartite tricarboxylate transporter substrate binding protein [Cupriavidus basilensis]